jgi:citrate lyase subunit beta / citryl-CoA lyase
MRSLLFVPGDDPRKIEKALTCGADALILDLEDSVSLSRKEAARDCVARALAYQPAPPIRLIVRINALSSGLVAADLAAIMPVKPAAIMLPKCGGGADVQHLGALLAVGEAEAGSVDGSTRIIAIATETPAALFNLGSLAGSSRRLDGVTWGGEDLAGAIGAETNRDEAGAYTAPYQLARSLALFAAHAAEVTAIDSVYTDFRNMAGLEAETLAARRDGFTAKMAIHPAQVDVINRIFTPDEAAITKAQRIITTFAENPDLGVIGLDGMMVDKPHLVQAQRVMKRAEAAGKVNPTGG